MWHLKATQTRFPGHTLLPTAIPSQNRKQMQPCDENQSLGYSLGRPADAPTHTRGAPGRLSPEGLSNNRSGHTGTPQTRGRKAQWSFDSNLAYLQQPSAPLEILFITQKVRFTWVNLQLEDVMGMVQPRLWFTVNLLLARAFIHQTLADPLTNK